MASNQIQPALLFMPDISGFTQFVNETELIHSQHIVQELLEILIETNDIGLEVQEIEGDAIFFYKLGEKPDLPKLLQQVEKMFTRFHQHLRQYEHQRICPCGACKATVQLQLKVVAHFGEVTGITVKQHKKLFGKDVILIHRLLKNQLQNKEYVLFTDQLLKQAHGVNSKLPAWYSPITANEQYDVGSVQFSFADLTALYESIPTSTFPVYNASLKTYVAFTKEVDIPAPMLEVFEAMLDLQQQSKMIEGTKKIEALGDDVVIRVGTRHSCLITKNNSVNITEFVKLEDEKIEMVEMSEKGMAGYRYMLRKISSNQTKLSVDMLVRNNPVYKLGFSIVFKSKMMRRFTEFFSNLQSYIKRQTLAEATI